MLLAYRLVALTVEPVSLGFLHDRELIFGEGVLTWFHRSKVCRLLHLECEFSRCSQLSEWTIFSPVNEVIFGDFKRGIHDHLGLTRNFWKGAPCHLRRKLRAEWWVTHTVGTRSLALLQVCQQKLHGEMRVLLTEAFLVEENAGVDVLLGTGLSLNFVHGWPVDQ